MIRIETEPLERQFRNFAREFPPVALDLFKKELYDKVVEVQNTASQMAPHDTGFLEGSWKILKGNTESKAVRGRELKLDIVFDADYAVFMHEFDYELGPGSERKDAASPFKVGPGYAERAVEEKKNIFKSWGVGLRAKTVRTWKRAAA